MTSWRSFGLLLAILLLFHSTAQSQSNIGRKTAESLRNNVVTIQATFSEGRSETGFGFIVGEEGGNLWIVTANHVVSEISAPEDSIPEIMVRLHCVVGTPWQRAERLPLSAGEPFDVAVLRVSAAGCNWNRQALAPTVVGLAGADVWYVGRGDELFIPQISGKIGSAEPDEYSTLRAEFPGVLPGSSGGPLITQDGIVGLIKSGEGIGGEIRVTSIDRIQKFFKIKWNLPWQLEIRSAVPVAEELSKLRQIWPVVLQEPLTYGSPRRFFFALGQYGAEKSFAPSPGGGLRVGGAHSDSVAWWDYPLDPPFLISTDLKIERKDFLQPTFWILGPGYGVNRESAYVLSIEDAQKVRLFAEGLAQNPALFYIPETLEVGQWYPVDLLVDTNKVKLFLKGAAIAEWLVSALPTGVLHSFVGLGARNGTTDAKEPSAAVFRNLEIRSPSGKDKELSGLQQLDPPIRYEERLPTCSIPLASFDFTQSVPPSCWTAIRDRGAVSLTPEGLLLRSGNDSPSVWLSEHYELGNFSAEFLVRLLPDADSVNLRFLIIAGEVGNTDKDIFDGWILAFPTGEGRIELRQIASTQVGKDFWSSYESSPVVARSTYFSPVNGRGYRIEFQRYRGKIRVFSNGGMLFELKDPWAEKSLPLSLGLTKIFGGVLVEKILVWTSCPPAAPVRVDAPSSASLPERLVERGVSKSPQPETSDPQPLQRSGGNSLGDLHLTKVHGTQSSLSGVITDDLGDGLPGATVTLWCGDPEELVITEADGSFTLVHDHMNNDNGCKLSCELQGFNRVEAIIKFNGATVSIEYYDNRK